MNLIKVNADFIHDRNSVLNNGHKVLAHSRTICEVSTPEGDQVIGIAYCSKKVNYCKKTGRKIALKKALDQLNLSKSDRVIIWNEYLNQANF
jgi:hypothetical protein